MDRDGTSSLEGAGVAKKKIQVLVHDDDVSNSNLWSLLEDHGFTVVSAPERKSPRYKGHTRRKIAPDTKAGRGTESGAKPIPQDLYEGTVRLEVMSDQRVRKMVTFVDQLRQNPGFRLLLMEANQSRDAVSILLGLREPIALGPALMAIEDVISVEAAAEPAAESSEPVLQVTLG